MELLEATGIFLDYNEFERGLSQKTIRAYCSDLCQYADMASKASMPITIEDIGKEEIRAYLKCITDKFKPKTAKRKMATLKAFFRFLECEDYIDNNPFRKIRIQIKEGLVLPRSIAPKDVKRLFRKVYLLRRSCLTKTARYLELSRDIAILELLFATGMRVSEVSGLKPADIDLGQGRLHVLGKGSRERTIPFCSNHARNALAEYWGLFDNSTHQRTWFFLNRLGNRLSEQSIRFMVRKHARGAGIETHVTPHMFRHTVATELLRNGMSIRSIQCLLGHSSIQTTQIYTHVDYRSQRRDIRRYHPRKHMDIGGPIHDN